MNLKSIWSALFEYKHILDNKCIFPAMFKLIDSNHLSGQTGSGGGRSGDGTSLLRVVVVFE